MRFLSLTALALVAAASASAQTPCTNGSADGYPCSRVGLYAHLPLATFATSGSPAPSEGNDIWGWTDPETDREYALVGLRNGTAFVDVTTPEAPVFLGKLPTATNPSTWRDIKTYGTFAFVVSEAGGHGMQVFDLTRLRNVTNPPQTFAADARYTGFGSAHNIVIDDVSGFAYGVGVSASTCGGQGLHMVDIRQPLAPTYAGCFDEDGYTHDAQCVVYNGPDTDHTGKQICVASNEDTVTIVDVTDKSSPVQISRGFYPNPGYTHQGWFTEDQRYFIVDDELDSSANGTRTIVMDLSDLDSPQYAFATIADIPVRDHNLYVRGSHAFLSNYEGGTRIYDLARIGDDEMTEVGFFDTYPQGNGGSFNGQWSNYPYFSSGVLIANDGNNGLFVLSPDPAFVASGVEPPIEVGPEGYALSDGKPNPSQGRVSFDLAVDARQQVSVDAYDLSGRLVAHVFSGAVGADYTESFVLDGRSLPAGAYVVRVTGETFTASRQAVLVR
ncbi:choice-of-anchor B family protein [Rubricoccus marinus]|uniref:Secretion system C-terminal sorting domain-containing protein n=1 Tax=Rubricoccus marinus TaxID=716817 RepID=A0A259TYE9_9BACT|nr:choice-of-anchor B family protein [Rubricoccus marinus]OZC02608.1 hypothetical protein BSZ36_06245 [Rubricoccus marinus]